MKELVEIMKGFDDPEGLSETHIRGVQRFRSNRAIGRHPVFYDPAICILAQGKKTLFSGERTIVYNPDTYLVTSVTIPTECIVHATPQEPALGLYIRFDMTMLHELIARLGPSRKHDSGKAAAINTSPMDAAIKDAVLRLVRCMTSEQDSLAIGQGMVRELLYRVLLGEQAHMLYELANHSGSFSRVTQALAVLKNNYAAKLDVDQLAATSNMSVSAFHRAFKEITGEPPIQYLKKLRLNKARDLMVEQGLKAYLAADRVGYESASQFSREFKRYFGQSPANMAREAWR